MKNSQYFNAEELCEHWKIKPFDLLKLIEDKNLKYETTNEFIGLMGLNIKDLEDLNFHKNEVINFQKKHPEYQPQETPYLLKPGEIPPYLDKKNKFSSEELFIAVSAWMAIYGTPGGLKSNRGHVGQIEAYIEKNYSVSGGAKNRIATVVNANKCGGSPKTS